MGQLDPVRVMRRPNLDVAQFQVVDHIQPAEQEGEETAAGTNTSKKGVIWLVYRG